MESVEEAGLRRRTALGQHRQLGGGLFALQMCQNHTLRGMRQLAHSFFVELGLEDAHFQSHNIITCNHLPEMINQAIAGLGWALVPLYACRSQLEQGLFNVDHEDQLVWNAESIWRTDTPINPALQIMIDALHQLTAR